VKDRYPDIASVDPAMLVPPHAQPDYAAPATSEVGRWANVGEYLSNRQVDGGLGSECAIITGETGTAITFAELATKSDDVAAGLVARGLRPGERVAYRMPNIAETLIVMCGIWKAGGIVVPIPMLSKASDVRFYLDDTAAVYLCVDPASSDQELIREAIAGAAVREVVSIADRTGPYRTILGARGALPQVESDSIAIIWHTGGTTGRPKGCYHTHRRFIYAGAALRAALDIKPGERWSAAAPLGHALGIIHNSIFTLLNGASTVLIERFQDPERLLAAVERCRVTTLTALLASWGKMLEVVDRGGRFDLSSVRRAYAMWQSASSAAIYDRWRAMGIKLLNNFGSTSFATWPIVPPPDRESPRAALGRATPGYEIAAVSREGDTLKPVAQGETGQLAVRGPTGLTYWNRPDQQARDVVDGWTLSDDLIRFDEAGNIHYLGRTDFMISTGGFKVAPVEVEHVLAAHASVREVAVVPGPCPIHREMVVAYVAVQQGWSATPELAAELKAFARDRLISYKAPKRIEFIDQLPRDGAGKVITKIVKDWANA
jgi:2-aminobenzoate-CoA ligase